MTLARSDPDPGHGHVVILRILERPGRLDGGGL